MKNIFLLTLLMACSQVSRRTDIFSQNQIKGCYLLYDVKAERFVKKIGETCKIRFPASSTFKVPLAVMAFDSEILKNEKQVLKWDGKKRFLQAWNKDHNAESWMRDSVVWFSQKLTPKLGRKRIQDYLNQFDYGNRNIAASLTDAWLNSAADPDQALSLNSYEQLNFMKKLWSGKLPASQRSQELTRKIMFIETLPNGFSLSGKTGSNTFDKEKNIQLGWFVACFHKDEEQYLSVMSISDVKPYEGQGYGGFRARELSKKLFEDFAKGKF